MVLIRSAWTWLSITVLIIVWTPVMAVTRLFDRDPGHYRTGRMFRRLGSAMVAASPIWSVEISGDYPDDPREPFVVVCNHQSLADIPFISRLPWDMKWVGKEATFKLPVVGWMMRVSDDIPVKRTDRRSRAKVFIEAMDRLDKRVSVMIMPEGTRTPDGRVRRFNDGAFKLAIRKGVRILPLAIDGSFDALPKGGWKFGQKSAIRLHVFDPVDPEDFGNDSTVITQHVRSMIVGRVAEWRGVDPAEVDATAPTTGPRD